MKNPAHAFATLAAIVLTVPLFAADETEIKEAQVPAQVMATFKQEAKGVTLSEFEQEKKKVVVVYTAIFKDKNGKEIEITSATDGTLISVAAEDDDDKSSKPKDNKDK